MWGDLEKQLSPWAPEPPGLAVCSRGIFTTVPEAEQAGSRPGAGSGQLEILERAGVSVLQRRPGRQGYSLAQPAQPAGTR